MPKKSPGHGRTNISAAPLVLGRYRLQGGGLLGEGGWCVVRQAEDVETGKRVAVKSFREQVEREVGRDHLEQRFQREVEIFRLLGASLRHGAESAVEPAPHA